MADEISPFEIIKALTTTNKNLISDGTITEKNYEKVSFLVNKGISLYPDTIFLANMMNINYTLPPSMQYDFYLSGIKKYKRPFKKWPKATDKTNEDFDVIQKYYSLNKEKTYEVLCVLTKEQISQIKKKMDKGGLE